MAHARRCKASARRQIRGSGITCRFSGPAAPAAERPAVMQIEGLLKLLPLTSPVISVLALLVAVLSYRRSGRKEAGEAHAATLDAALDLEMTLRGALLQPTHARPRGVPRRGRGCSRARLRSVAQVDRFHGSHPRARRRASGDRPAQCDSHAPSDPAFWCTYACSNGCAWPRER